jgi:6-pyruvoyltetrahydropterin/6-carboxytetrahydropterin synthase
MKQMQETFTEFTFDAAHKTTPETPLHGHTFRVRVVLVGDRDPRFGWSHDLLSVHEVVEKLKTRIDQSYLNEIEGLELPTLENTAQWIFDTLSRELAGIDRVTLERGAAGFIEGCTVGSRS